MANVILNDKHLTDIADAIRAKNGEATTYTPGEMAEAITDLPSGGGSVEPIVLTGDCKYGCSGQLASRAIELYGDTITTSGIADADYMFSESTITKIPFEINFDNSTTRRMTYMFYRCRQLQEVPVMNNVAPAHMYHLFDTCTQLRYLPENFGLNWQWSYILTNTNSYASYLFNGCSSLRSVPSTFLANLRGKQTSYNYHPYAYTFTNCYALDGVECLGVATGTLTSNMFKDTFSKCCRLKKLTFDLNPYGEVQTANWKNQTINLGGGVGYTGTAFPSYITSYNSGLTSETQITDDESYQRLKDNPDSWTTLSAYSRYNHDSAVETINTLPDTSAYLATQSGATNTIYFEGAIGASTDGGAINTLTEEEIAVATAKGWTVAL